MTLSSQALADILKQATSPQTPIRDSAYQYLQQLQSSDFNQLASKLLDLLSSRDRSIHILAYSYLLNEVIIKVRRLPERIVVTLEKIYFCFYQIAREEYTFGPNNFQLQQQNIVTLIVAIYSKSSELKARNEFFQRNLPIFCSNDFERKVFLKKIFERLVQALCFEQRKRSMILSMFFQQVLFQVWGSRTLFNYQVAIDISYFLAIFPQQLWKRLTILLNEENIPEHLTLKIIERCFTAMGVQHNLPNIQHSFRLYQKLKSLCLGMNLQKISQQNMHMILATVYHSLNVLITKQPLNSTEVQYISLILNIEQYKSLIYWLINISSDTVYEDEVSRQITQRAVDIIIIYSEKMPEGELQAFFQDVYNHIDCQNQEKVLLLLSGAPRKIHQIFNSHRIFQHILSSRDLASEMSPYLLFLQRYVINEYLMESNLVSLLEKKLMRYLHIFECSLREASCSKPSQQKLLIQISIILSTLMLSAKYSRNTTDETSFINFVCANVFNYLGKSTFGLPDIAHDKLYQHLSVLISFDNMLYNNTICCVAVHVYHDLFLTIGDLPPEKQRKTSQLRQQLLCIIRQTLPFDLLSNENLLPLIKVILCRFNPEDIVIAKQILFLLGKYMQIYNSQLVKLELYQMISQLNTNKEYINFELRQSFQDIFFSEKFHQFLNFINSNLDYDFASNIRTLVDEFFTALKVLIELSIHPYCFGFVEEMAYKLILYMQDEASSLETLYQTSRRKHIKVTSSIYQLKRLPTYLDCLLQTMYLNPKWRDISRCTELKMLIMQSDTFQECKQRIDLYVAGDITKMMEQVSIQANQRQQPLKRWDRAYLDLLSDSGVGQFCEGWINMLRGLSDC